MVVIVGIDRKESFFSKMTNKRRIMRNMFLNATEIGQQNQYISYTANLSCLIAFPHILPQFFY